MTNCTLALSNDNLVLSHNIAASDPHYCSREMCTHNTTSFPPLGSKTKVSVALTANNPLTPSQPSQRNRCPEYCHAQLQDTGVLAPCWTTGSSGTGQGSKKFLIVLPQHISLETEGWPLWCNKHCADWARLGLCEQSPAFQGNQKKVQLLLALIQLSCHSLMRTSLCANLCTKHPPKKL